MIGALTGKTEAMPFWRLSYHVVWVTKHREPAILDGMVEPMTRIVAETAADLGVTDFAIGIMPDHVHVLAWLLDYAIELGDVWIDRADRMALWWLERGENARGAG